MHPDHRVRLRRRRGEHHGRAALVNKLLWIGLLLVVLVYGVILVYFTLKARSRSPVASAPVAVAAPGPVLSAPVAPRPDQRPLGDEIKDWKRAQVLVREAAAMISGDNLPMLEDRLRKALELAPEHQQARELNARLLERKQQHADAELAWRAVLARDPERVEARVRLADTLLASQRPDEALIAARWALEGDPYSAAGHQIAASALNELKQPQEAITHLRRLASMNREDLAVQNNLGVAYLAVRDYAGALAIFREVLRADPNNSVAFYNLAVCHAHRNSVDESVDVLKQAAQKFGHPFVLAWTQSTDFDPIRTQGRFIDFVDRRDETPPAFVPEADAVELPGIPE